MVNSGFRLHILHLALAASVLVLASLSAEAQVIIDHSAGFAGQTDLTLNGATLNGTFVQITPDQGNLARSFFSTSQVPVNTFQTTFTFHMLTGTAGYADGMGFCIQRVGPTATGGTGGAMGYTGIGNSIFVKFDNYPGPPGATSTTQIYTNGADPADAGSINLLPTINWNSQNNFRCDMSYDGTTLTSTITDLTTMAALTQNYTINIPTVIGGSMAHGGFTAGTGGETAIHEVLTWTYSALHSSGAEPRHARSEPGRALLERGHGGSALHRSAGNDDRGPLSHDGRHAVRDDVHRYDGHESEHLLLRSPGGERNPPEPQLK